jgi:2',3'-cyclic-nucleotide 2'-phosphodiesterase (5'-nucleotidase family)
VDGGKAGGMDRLAHVIKQYRTRYPHSLLLFPGDLISPSLESSVFKGAQLIEALNLLRVDAASPGNHEFDYGADEFAKRIRESRFAWLASNVTVAPGVRGFPGTRPWMIQTVGGVAVGLIGLLTVETYDASSPGATLIADPITVAKALVPILRRNGAQAIIALTHLTMAQDQRLLAEVPEIDVIVGGHDHDPMTHERGGRMVAKAGADSRWLGVTHLTVSQPRSTRHELVAVTDQTPSDPQMAAFVKRYTDEVNRQFDVVIGEAVAPLDARNAAVRQQEAPLGNLIADVMKAAINADVAITNGGGIRTNAVFPAGPIRRKDVLAWLPFGNLIVGTTVRGSDVRAALENGVSAWADVGGRFPQVSGITFTFTPSRPAGSRVSDIRINGQPVDETARYRVATNDFLLRGGDGYTSLAAGEVFVSPANGPIMATAVADAIQRMRTVNPRVEGRIRIVR